MLYIIIAAIFLNIMYFTFEDVKLSYHQNVSIYNSYTHSKTDKKMDFNIEKDKSTVTAADVDLNTIGVLVVPSIHLKIPIYEDKVGHETSPSETAISSGAAIIKSFNRFSDFEKGKTKSSRVILTAHTGLSIGKLFNDLPKINKGDLLYVKEFATGKEYVYKVESKVIVNPDEIERLMPEKGKEELTLLSCYPLFVNSQRILVTGERIHEAPKEEVFEMKSFLEKPSMARECVHNPIFMAASILFLLTLFKIVYNITYNKTKK